MKKTLNKREQDEACFGAGCFWSVQAEFDSLQGIIKTDVGYMGGSVELNKENPYSQVCTDTTGHAEVVRILFNPNKISYKELLEKFFSLHDPTQVNRQGPDIGSQYRSVIFFYNKKQENSAKQTIKEKQKFFSKKIVTEIVPASKFYKAEEYHQKYLKKRGMSSCKI